MNEIKVGTKLIALEDYPLDNGKKSLRKNKEYEVFRVSDSKTMFSVKSELYDSHSFDICGSIGRIFKIKEDFETPKHYDNTNGSLYKVSQERGWNSYLFDIVKRLERANKKGEFETDLQKSKLVIDLWLQEQK
jgi:hypothetical protein